MSVPLLIGMKKTRELLNMQIKLSGSVRVIYEHGEPHGIRDDSGYICFFNSVTKFPGQDDRYRREIVERQEIADFMCDALNSADRKV